jgi:replicative DNA helicase
MEAHIDNEEKLIGLFLGSKETAKRWTQEPVSINYFDKVHQNILSGVIFAVNNGVQLTRQSYKDFLDSYKSLTPAEIAAEVSLYNRCVMKGGKVDDLPMMLDKVKDAYVRRKTSQFFNEYKKEKDLTGDLDANRKLVDKLSALEADSVTSKIEVLEIHKAKDRFLENLYERKNNPNVRLTCGIPEIDDTMNVGFKPGHLTLFCADVGSFKTTMMVNVALNIFKRSQNEANILYIPLEMPADEILHKIVSRETKIPNNIIEHAEYITDEQIKIISLEMDKWASLQNKFHIMEMVERTKVSVLRREIEKRIHYFKPRMVFVDYVDNLIPDERNSRSDLEMNNTLEDLRKMGQALGFGVVSAAQLSRDVLKKLKESKNGSVSSTDIRGGQVMTANSDTVYAQWRDPANPAQNLIFTCIKARHGQNLFANNADKAILKVEPSIGLIESVSIVQKWNGDKDRLNAKIGIAPPQSVFTQTDDAPF